MNARSRPGAWRGVSGYWPEQRWFLRLGEETTGPFDYETLSRWHHEGGINGATIAQHANGGSWVPYREVLKDTAWVRAVAGSLGFGLTLWIVMSAIVWVQGCGAR